MMEFPTANGWTSGRKIAVTAHNRVAVQALKPHPGARGSDCGTTRLKIDRDGVCSLTTPIHHPHLSSKHLVDDSTA